MKRKTLPLLKIIISKMKVAIFADKSFLATEKQNKVLYSKSQHSTEAEVGHFSYFDCNKLGL